MRLLAFAGLVALPFLGYIPETAEMFWGSLMVSVFILYLAWIPFIWIPAGLVMLGGLLSSDPFLFVGMTFGWGVYLQIVTNWFK